MKECPTCHATTDAVSLCRRCGRFLRDPGLGLQAASLWRRFFAHLLDNMLVLVTLIVGWLIWFFFTAKQGQSPGKKLLGIRCMKLDGTPPTAGTMWLRDVVVKELLWSLFIPLGLIPLPFLWAFWDKDKQTLHDKMVNTLMVNTVEATPTLTVPQSGVPLQRSTRTERNIGVSPEKIEEELRRLAKLRDDGLITPEEFEEKRQSLAQKL